MKIRHCPSHPAHWSRGCDGCRTARAETLASVQFCTVHGSGQCVCDLMDLAAAAAPWRVRRVA